MTLDRCYGLIRIYLSEVLTSYVIIYDNESVNLYYGGKLISASNKPAIRTFQIQISRLLLNSGFQRTKAHAFYESKGFDKLSYCFTKNISSRQN